MIVPSGRCVGTMAPHVAIVCGSGRGQVGMEQMGCKVRDGPELNSFVEGQEEGGGWWQT